MLGIFPIANITHPRAIPVHLRHMENEMINAGSAEKLRQGMIELWQKPSYE